MSKLLFYGPKWRTKSTLYGICLFSFWMKSTWLLQPTIIPSSRKIGDLSSFGWASPHINIGKHAAWKRFPVFLWGLSHSATLEVSQHAPVFSTPWYLHFTYRYQNYKRMLSKNVLFKKNRSRVSNVTNPSYPFINFIRPFIGVPGITPSLAGVHQHS